MSGRYGLWNAPAQKKKDNGTAKDLQVSRPSSVSPHAKMRWRRFSELAREPSVHDTSGRLI